MRRRSMPRFYVSLSAKAYVTGILGVVAPTKEEAGKLALEEASNGDIVWKYNGVTEDADITVEEIA
jgi:hypothetical protein